MRTLCDACESAAAIVFCAADEAALCHACDEKVFFFFFCQYFLDLLCDMLCSLSILICVMVFRLDH